MLDTSVIDTSVIALTSYTTIIAYNSQTEAFNSLKSYETQSETILSEFVGVQ
jgi:hypothetical protein